MDDNNFMGAANESLLKKGKMAATVMMNKNQYNSMDYEKASSSTINAPRQFLEMQTKVRVRPLNSHMTFRDSVSNID